MWPLVIQQWILHWLETLLLHHYLFKVTETAWPCWLCHSERRSPNKSQVMNTQCKRVFGETFVLWLVVFFLDCSKFHLPLFYWSSCLQCAFYKVEYLTKLIIHTSLQTTASLKVFFFCTMNIKDIFIAKSTVGSHNGNLCDNIKVTFLSGCKLNSN